MIQSEVILSWLFQIWSHPVTRLISGFLLISTGATIGAANSFEDDLLPLVDCRAYFP